jgi:glutathione peroxidase-family protein
MSASNETNAAAEAHRFDQLPGVDGKPHSLVASAGRTATVVVFIANGCPTARAYEERLVALQDNWGASGVELIAINSNNPHLSPPDTFAEMVRRSSQRRINFLYLKDEDGAVAERFGAICTPHAFVLDRQLRIAYSGRIDDSRLGDRISTHDLEDAITDVVAGRPVRAGRTEPFGCSIVWS